MSVVEAESPSGWARDAGTGLHLPQGAGMLSSRLFARVVLKQDHYDAQERLLDAIDAHPKVAIKGAHGVGKTRAVASAALAFLLRYKDAIVLSTAPTQNQVKRLLWREIHRVLRESEVVIPKVLELEIAVSRDQYMLGLATNEGVRFQGFHSGHLMIIFDEAPGVLPDIWKSTEGIMSGGHVRLVALGNPVLASGDFHEAFGEESDWHTETISAFDSPNLRNEAEARPYTIDELLAMPKHELEAEHPRWAGRGLAGRAWVVSMYRKYGPQDGEYQSRVLGIFPGQSPDSLMAMPWLREAQRLGRLPDLGDEWGGELAWTAGIDVAGEGDAETVVAIWQGDVIRDIGRFAESDPRASVLDFLEPYREMLTWGPPRPALRVDSIGQGYYFLRHLEDQGYLGYAVGVNVSEAADAMIPPHRVQERADAKKRYANLKSRLYWALRERFRGGRVIGHMLPNEAVDQLAGLRYRIVGRGLIEIESKKAARARGAVSPDIAEAIMLGGAPLRAMPIANALAYSSARPGGGRSREVARGRRR